MPKPAGSGGPPPKGSQNARRHGAYSENLTPAEEQDFHKILADYIDAIGRPSKAERQLLERISFLEAKWNTAAPTDAPYRALNYLHKLLWAETETLACLPRTRTTAAKGHKTMGDILFALSRRMYRRIYMPLAPQNVDP